MFEYQRCLNQALNPNLKNLLEVLRKLGVKQVDINYNGCGDSGGTETITIDPPLNESTLNKRKVDWQHPEFVHRAGGPHYELEQKKRPLKEALEYFALSWVNALYSGWEINEGAYGTVTIDVVSGNCTLDHNEYMLESYQHEHSL